ncbi:4-coumarate- ligase [Ophiostoma piceae UAMH 11346]|uniref:4-coumarate-ligase n=1 Tax=Ophiostoma piceae (strain UAMH 11346) TaxID=1262450 RepID=S3C6S9_OPHP1|nr:4-coumarate- ligase [Ophiostoma piceae UAMH 11346]
MRIYSSGTIDIPRNVNLTELLHKTGRPLPESHLIAADSLTNRSITLGELRDRAGRIAKALHDKLQPQDQARWALIVPNSVDFLEIFHAILWTGGIVAPINWALKDAEIGHGIAVSQPKYIVAYGAIMDLVNRAIRVAEKELDAAGTTWQRPVVVSIVTPVPGLLHIGTDFLAPAGQRLPIPHYPDTSDRVATIHLSSGTTGKPKGVQLTHLNYVANVLQLFAHDPKQFHAGSRTVTITPWAHIGMTTMPLFNAPYMGLFHHAMPSYNLEQMAAIAGSCQATTFQGPPSVVLQMARSDITKRFDFSHAQTITVGGANFKSDVLDPLLKMAPWKLVQVYGMTEAAGYVAFQKLDEEVPQGVVGYLLPSIEACLKKEGTGEDVPEGAAGELWLRGPNITKGYLFNSDATRSAFPAPGWYNTGDVCKIDRLGRISIVGRTKELIKYKGFQVSPAELESYINSHPAVSESGVAATWDESQLTELPTAWVVLKDEVAHSPAAIKSALKDIHASIDAQVSGYKKLRGGVWHIKALPKNATGKILRKPMAAMRDVPSSLDKPASKL